MEMKKVNLPHRQAGMTMIEMAVSLAVMVGVAGMVMPVASGFLDKAHNSTTVGTLKDLNGTINQYINSKMSLPDKLESLVDGSSNGAIYTKLQDRSMLEVLPEEERVAANTALASAGVTGVWVNAETTSDATFQSVDTTAGLQSIAPYSSSVKLARLKGTNREDTFYGQLQNLTDDPIKNQLIYAFGGNETAWDTTCTNYIVMGIGGQNSMVPTAMASAPVHFAGDKDHSSQKVYNRFAAVFAVPKADLSSGTNAVTNQPCMDQSGDKAKFIGSAMIMPFPAIVGLAGSTQYANAKALKD